MNEARERDAVLHSCFEWNDDVAGEEWRKGQARGLLTHLVIVEEKAPARDGLPVFVNVRITSEDEDFRAYLASENAMSDERLRAQVLQQALRDLQAWERRYQHLQELAKVFDASFSIRNALGFTDEKKDCVLRRSTALSNRPGEATSGDSSDLRAPLSSRQRA